MARNHGQDYDNNNNNNKSLYFNTQSKRLSLHIKNTTIRLLLLFTSILVL